MKKTRLFTMNINEDLDDKLSAHCKEIPCYKSHLVQDLIANYLYLYEKNLCPYPVRFRPNETSKKSSHMIRIDDKTMDGLAAVSSEKGIKRTELIRSILDEYMSIYTKRMKALPPNHICKKCNKQSHEYTHCPHCLEKK